MVLKLQEVDQKYLESFEVWCWRRMEISWTDRVRNEEALDIVKVKIEILHTIKRREANWICHSVSRNCIQNTFLKER
jgi:hypothetical protein